MMNINKLLRELSNITPNDKPDKIRELILSTKAKIIVPKLLLEKGSVIFRASPIDDISEVTSPQRLSYKPTSMNKSYQRASTPFNTMFYGIVSEDYPSAVMGCLAETCDCLRSRNAPLRHYKIVISQWELKEDIALVQMLDIHGNNKSRVFRNYQEAISVIDAFNAENERENKAFLEFMGNEFKKVCQQESDYWISAIYTEFLTLVKGDEGIVYESVQVVDPRLREVKCVALAPNFVDSCLEFMKGEVYDFDYKGINEVIVPRKKGDITF